LGEDLQDSCLRLGICVTEKPTKQQSEKLRESFGYESVMIDYGATEFPGFSVQCRGNPEVHHVWSDYYLVEAVDPETHEPVQEGERGELVITSLQREAFPLIRYLSNDVTKLIGFEECDCGLTHFKIGAKIDRKDFMVKVKGTPVFPSALEKSLENYVELTGRCQIVVNKRTPSQEMILKVETGRDLSKMNQEMLKNQIRRKIKSSIGITLDEIVLVPFGTFEDKLKKRVVLE
jgi:phenylacetate-CoA ligase